MGRIAPVYSEESWSAVEAGGWDPRYAVVLVVRTVGDVRVALIDTNGDGADIDLDHYRRDANDGWVELSSGGGAGDSGASWSPEAVTLYGRSAPGETVTVEYAGQRHAVTAGEAGWWLFLAAATAESGGEGVRTRWPALPRLVR